VLPLAYNSNLHPAESVAELAETITRFAGELRQRLGWEQLGIDLRLGSRAIAECAADSEKVALLRQSCEQARVVPFSINAFPLGRFQAPVVKDQAYHPDWNSAQRLADSAACIAIASALCDDNPLTISTLPLSYKPWGAEHNDHDAMARMLGLWAGDAALHQRDHGREVVLCLEPEPWCTLESSAEVAAFWNGPLAEQGLLACAQVLDGDENAAREALARHLSICFDTCHFSVGFEDQEAAVQTLGDCGAFPAKLQFSACPQLSAPRQNPEALRALAQMSEPRFLHQTAARGADGRIHRVRDLDEIEQLLIDCPDAEVVRSQFHIPIDRAPAGGLASTVDDSLRGLAAALRRGTTHIAVETYTWSILADDEADALSGTQRELEWLREQIDGLGHGPETS